MTVVYDLKEGRLVWAGEGRTQATLERFFDSLGEEGSKRLEAVCCDMWRSYVNAGQGAGAPGGRRLRQVPHREPSGKGGRRCAQAGDPGEGADPQGPGEEQPLPVAEEPVAPHRRPGRAARDPREAEHRGPPGLPAEGDVPALLGVQAPGLGQALPRALVRPGPSVPGSRRCGSSPARCSATWTTFSTTSALGSATLPWKA